MSQKSSSGQSSDSDMPRIQNSTGWFCVFFLLGWFIGWTISGLKVLPLKTVPPKHGGVQESNGFPKTWYIYIYICTNIYIYDIYDIYIYVYIIYRQRGQPTIQATSFWRCPGAFSWAPGLADGAGSHHQPQERPRDSGLFDWCFDGNFMELNGGFNGNMMGIMTSWCFGTCFSIIMFIPETIENFNEFHHPNWCLCIFLQRAVGGFSSLTEDANHVPGSVMFLFSGSLDRPEFRFLLDIPHWNCHGSVEHKHAKRCWLGLQRFVL